MKLGVFTMPLGDKSLEETLQFVCEIGATVVEIGTGGYNPKFHCDPSILLSDENAFNEFIALFKKYNVEIGTLSCHANPVHPDKNIAKQHDKELRDTILLAEKLGLDTVTTFSGCPGGSAKETVPNWITCFWPADFKKAADYQWNDVLIPYWTDLVAFGKMHGVTKFALEMHPGFSVYNPGTLKKLRQAVGIQIGANFDPAHLIWQGIDPAVAIKDMEGMIYHVHAKDTLIDKANCMKNGVLDITGYDNEKDRSWTFRTVGYGMENSLVWKDIVIALRMTGYEGVISIENEDTLMTVEEGLKKAAEYLKTVILFEETHGFWWENN